MSLPFIIKVETLDLCYMARKTKEAVANDKELARALFIHDNLTRKAIAERLGYTEKTIGAWATKGDWEKSKKTISYSKHYELQRLLDQLEELNNHIANRPEGERFPNSKEADVQKKLNSSIRDLEVEMNIKEAVNVSIQLVQYINQRDALLAKKLGEYIDAWLRGLQ
jgi:hypothetical protein